MHDKRLILALFLFCIGVNAAVRLKIQGSSTVNPVVAEAADHFRGQGWTVRVDTQGGSLGGISALARGFVQVAMSSKPITAADRAKYPGIEFVSYPIGYDGIALVVSKPIYDSGIQSLSRDQMTDLYESRIQNWQALGGPNLPVTFFNKKAGSGTWEVFAKFLYGDVKSAPKVAHPVVGTNEQARIKVSSHPSAITQLSAAWADTYPNVRVLGLKNEKGKVIYPSEENVRVGTYPLRRPLLLVTNGKATPHIESFIAYLLSKPGQSIVQKFGYLPLNG